jgi:hypothetical protein
VGWSCSSAAGDVLRDWFDECHDQEGSGTSTNSYLGTDAVPHFFETSRREYDDGHITGKVLKRYQDGPYYVVAGSFRINADGSVARYPHAWPFRKESSS